jgi:hypothetical protein
MIRYKPIGLASKVLTRKTSLVDIAENDAESR